MFLKRHTFESVAKAIVSGLQDGSVTLPQTTSYKFEEALRDHGIVLYRVSVFGGASEEEMDSYISKGISALIRDLDRLKKLSNHFPP